MISSFNYLHNNRQVNSYVRYNDEKSYTFHNGDSADICFLCKRCINQLFVVRQIATGKMVHLCRECMLDNLSEYLLDNTRPWKGPKEKK